MEKHGSLGGGKAKKDKTKLQPKKPTEFSTGETSVSSSK